MCVGGSPKTPAAPAPPPPPPAAPSKSNTADQRNAAVQTQRKKALQAQGRNSTILTGPFGVQEDANTKQNTLLG